MKILLSALNNHPMSLLGVLLLGLACFYLPQVQSADRKVTEPLVKKQTVRLKKNIALNSSSLLLSTEFAALPMPSTPPGELAAFEYDEWVTSQVYQMDTIAKLADASRLPMVLAELKNEAAQIRMAALNAIIATGSRVAIPYLEKLSAQTTDAVYQQSINEAILQLEQLSFVEAHDQEGYESGALAPSQLHHLVKVDKM